MKFTAQDLESSTLFIQDIPHSTYLTIVNGYQVDPTTAGFLLMIVTSHRPHFRVVEFVWGTLQAVWSFWTCLLHPNCVLKALNYVEVGFSISNDTREYLGYVHSHPDLKSFIYQYDMWGGI